ncbi:glycosyltransferase [Emcibacter sp. SYSU 3D8]|uniref:glycosyltransferase n=1 Tax=Emcibacter sp. SYSU 3D8 TaxID=3133969 RepID=UPI0031FE9624
MGTTANDPLDILFVLDNLSGGGAQRVAVNLANGLQARGHRVRVLLFEHRGPLRGALAPAIQVIELGIGRARHALWPLARMIGALRPGVVLSFLPHVNVLAILAARLAGGASPVVVTEHNQPDPVLLAMMSPGYARATRLARLLYRFAAALVCCTPGIRQAWVTGRGLRADRVHAVHNPVVTAEMLDGTGRPPAHPWARDPSVPLIAAAGRMSAEKDLAMLLRAFARLRQGRAARLLLMGNGVLRPELEALAAALGIADDVDMPGYVDDPHGVFRAAQVVAVSSVSEGFSNVVIEALACGTGVVVTDCFSPADRLTMHGWVQAMVPVGDDAAMARALAEAIDAPSDPDALRAHVSGLTSAAAIDNYEAVLRRVLAR